MIAPPRRFLDRPRSPADVACAAAVDRAAASRALRRPAFWHSLVAEHGLHVSGPPIDAGRAEDWLSVPDAGSLARARSDLAGRGYLHWSRLVDPDRSASLARGVTALCRQGWDAALIGLVDEAWQLCFHLAAVMGSVMGGHADSTALFRRELFAFCVDPGLAAGRARGVPAHRDRPDSGYDRVGGLALPRHCTCWVSLTDADEANGCMYVIPTRADDDASLVHAPVESAQGRPLVTRAGDMLVWNGQVVHWGGRHAPDRARGPRIALSFSMTHPAIPSLGGFAAVQATLPGFAERLSLISTLVSWLNPPARGSAADVALGLLRDQP
jgi:hypothetical protein